MRETLLLDVPHRQVVLTIPKTLRIFFKYRRRLLGEFSRAAVRTLTAYYEALAGAPLVPGIIDDEFPVLIDYGAFPFGLGGSRRWRRKSKEP